MKTLFFLLLAALPQTSHALDIFDLNVFDQLQGEWKPDFRGHRMKMVSDYIQAKKPDIVVFEEAKGVLPGAQKGGEDSVDAELLKKDYPFRKYVFEMAGKDEGAYGYWIGAKKKPREWIEDGFAFEGGVARRVIAGIWDKAWGKECVGVIGLHLSYQTTDVRQKEAAWLLDWLKAHEAKCPHWVVVGDFNAEAHHKEMQVLFDGGLKSLFSEVKPTVGPFNPIRRIYGETIPTQTIDWALGWNLDAEASVVLNQAAGNDPNDVYQWASDHAGVWVHLNPKRQKYVNITP